MLKHKARTHKQLARDLESDAKSARKEAQSPVKSRRNRKDKIALLKRLTTEKQHLHDTLREIERESAFPV
jgi:hypothetical protein